MSSVTVAPQYPILLWVLWQLHHNTLHFCEFCNRSGTPQRIPWQLCTQYLHFCAFCDCCTTIPYTSVSSVTHPVPYRDYPPVLEQIQYPTEITRTLQNLSVTFHENGVEGLHGVVMVQGLPIMCHSHQLQLRLYTKKKTKQTENSARMHSIEGNNN